MPRADMRRGVLLRCYLLLSYLFPLVAPFILKKRLAKGKEHEARWVEKLGQGLAPRPDGPLIWLNAVGLGEILSLRGLIARMHQLRPDLSFLVTSTTATSAQVFSKNLPPRTLHQFLPIDGPGPRARFLDHFQPDLCIWAEQDLWPGFVSSLAKRHIPQAIVAARMNQTSFQSHRRARGVYRDLYGAMDLVSAQDDATAAHLNALGAQATATGSLKPAAPTLGCDEQELAALTKRVQGRRVWATAPSHQADENIALAAHQQLLKDDPTALLIIAPRFPQRSDIAPDGTPRRSNGQSPTATDGIWLCDTFGDLGLVYRLAKTVLVGGTFDDTEGHNPWEAAALGATVIHGPRTENFANDFKMLNQSDASVRVTNVHDLYDALRRNDLQNIAQRASDVVTTASESTGKLASDLIALMDR